MPYTDEDDYEGDEADLHEKEDPDPEDADWNLDPATVKCPYCHREIFEDASLCPYCKNFISHEDAPAARKPTWIIIGMVFVVLILIVWILEYTPMLR